MSLNELPLAIVDIETTGGRAYQHRIIEIGALKVVNGEVVETFSSLIDPERAVPPSITQLTGIHDGMLIEAPTFGSIADELYEFLDGCIFTAHNVRFDYGFIRQEFERIGRKFNAQTLCSVRLSRALFPRFKRHDLSSIISRFDLEMQSRHRAFDDAKAVWDFFKVMESKIPQKKVSEAIKKIVRRPSLPPGLKTSVNDLPETPGVYFFHGQQGEVLYIGKAKDLRSRILSHFSATLSSNKEMTLAQQVTDIECVQTHGELSALLLESYYIKKMLPLYNRRSRRSWQLSVIKLDKSKEYHRVLCEAYQSIRGEDLGDIITVFKTRRNARNFLDGLAFEHKLCKTLLGIEKNHSKHSCLYYEMNQCRGACAKKEDALRYNLRLAAALANHQKLRWPFNGPIQLEEKNYDGTKGEVIVVNNWIVQDAFRYHHEEREPLFEVDYTFDLDAFRILYGQIKRNKQLILKVLSS